MILNKLFNFLASLKLAVILLVIFAAILSWATFYEAGAGTEEAQRLIYRSRWFDLFLFVLGLNVACAALSRFPWKSHHAAFVVTHTGILIILIGSLITRKYGVEGQLMLQEGESADHILLNDTVLAVSAPRLAVREEFDPWFLKSGIPEGKEIRYPLKNTGIVCVVDRYLFNPQTLERVTDDASAPNPAVQVAVFRPGANDTNLQDWLLANDPGRNTLDLGIASVRLRAVASPEELQQRLPSLPTAKNATPESPGQILLLNSDKKTVQTLDLKTLEARPIPLEYNHMVLTVKLAQLLPHAAIQQGKLTDNPQGKFNPAARFEIQGPSGTEEHLSFALFPEFGSMHGQNPSLYGLEGQLVYPFEEPSDSGNRVNLYLGPDQRIYYTAANSAGRFATGTVEIGGSFDTGWNGLQLQVKTFYANARMTQELSDAGMSGSGQHNNPMLHVRLENQGETAASDVAFNSPVSVTVGGETCEVEFGQKRYPLNFTIELIQFEAPRYPGTNRPARFQSQVKLIDSAKQLERKQLISMNNPLDYNHFLVFQSSYIEGGNGQPNVSIFSVAWAPGTPIIYIGAIVLILGMVLMFVPSRFSRRNSLTFTSAPVSPEGHYH